MKYFLLFASSFFLFNCIPAQTHPVVLMASGGTDFGYEVATGPNGDIYVAGQTGTTSDFHPADFTYGNSIGGADAFVCHFDRNLNLISTAILASSGADEGLGIAVDPANGNVFVSGTTTNVADFALYSTTWGTPAVNERNGFVCKLSPALDSLYSTAIICSDEKDEAHDVIVGNDGSVFVTGQAGNDNFICGSCPGHTKVGDNEGDVEAFVTKLSNDLNTHIQTTLLTSSQENESYAVAIDGNNKVFIAGRTRNYQDFADSKEYYGGQPNAKVGYSAFVSRFDYNLTHEKTGIAGSDIVSDVVRGLAIDSSGNIFVCGLTEHESTFPKSPKHNYGAAGDPTTFVMKLANNLQTHFATAILSSPDKDKAFSIAIDANQQVVIGGYTMGGLHFTDNPTGLNGAPGVEDGFLTVLNNDLTVQVQSDVLASAGVDVIYGLAIADDGGILAVGETDGGPNFTFDANTTLGTSGGTDAFLLKLGGIFTHTPEQNISTPDARILYTDQGPEIWIKVLEAGNVSYQIWDVTGREIAHQDLKILTSGTYHYPLAIQSPGIYLVQVTIGGKGIKLKVLR